MSKLDQETVNALYATEKKLFLEAVEKISNIHGNPRFKRDTLDRPVRTDKGECHRLSVVWFINSVNTGFHIDLFSPKNLYVRSHKNSFEPRIWQVEFHVRSLQLSDIMLAATLVGLYSSDEDK